MIWQLIETYLHRRFVLNGYETLDACLEAARLSAAIADGMAVYACGVML